jgi:hypothetical protein
VSVFLPSRTKPTVPFTSLARSRKANRSGSMLVRHSPFLLLYRARLIVSLPVGELIKNAEAEMREECVSFLSTFSFVPV